MEVDHLKQTGVGGSTKVLFLDDGGVQHISTKEEAEAFASIFCQKCQAGYPSWPPPEFPSIKDNSLRPIRFTPQVVKKRLKTLDAAKTVGPVHILAIVLKICASE
eukprot:g41775.t1